MKKINSTIKKIFKAIEKASEKMAQYQDRDSVICCYAGRSMWH